MRFNFAKLQFFKLTTFALLAGIVFSIYMWIEQYGSAMLPFLLFVPMAVAYLALLAYMAWMWLVVNAPKKRLIDELRRQCKKALTRGQPVVTGANSSGVAMTVRESGKKSYHIEMKTLKENGGNRAAWLVDPTRIERAEMDDMAPVAISQSRIQDAINMLIAFNSDHLNADFVEDEDALVKEKLEQLRTMPLPVAYELADAVA